MNPHWEVSETDGTSDAQPAPAINRAGRRPARLSSPKFARLSLSRSYRLIVTAIFITAAGLLTSARADDTIPPKIPLQDFFRNPKAAGYNLSDDGKFLAFLAPWQNRLNVWVQSVTGGEPTRL